jgi:hypothetical protein
MTRIVLYPCATALLLALQPASAAAHPLLEQATERYERADFDGALGLLVRVRRPGTQVTARRTYLAGRS